LNVQHSALINTPPKLVLTIKIIFQKNKKRRRRKKEIGATPLAKNGVAEPPHFWPRGGSWPVWGWSSHPHDYSPTIIGEPYNGHLGSFSLGHKETQ
jgi:hypothetical protein